MKSKNMTTVYVGTSISRSRLRRGLPALALILACFAVSGSPKVFGDSGTQNTANGSGALSSNTTGSDNTVSGFQALFNNTTGVQNTAVGSGALSSQTFGVRNTAIGYQALFNNTAGDNTANGNAALYSNTSGINNTAIGANALHENTTNPNNTGVGSSALYFTTGGYNVGVGANAGANISTGSNKIAIGYNAGTGITAGTYNIQIGNSGVAADSNIIRIGVQGTQVATYVAGIYGTTASSGTAVYINSSGKLGTATSSARFKQDIRGMGNASDTILSLRPVTFRYKPELDPDGTAQFGLVAEEVATVNPDLVVRDPDGKPYSVRYEAVNAMLLNEFLKEHKKVQNLEATVAQQQASFDSKLAKQEKQIAELTSALQRVSTRLETNQPATSFASNKP